MVAEVIIVVVVITEKPRGILATKPLAFLVCMYDMVYHHP